MPLGGANMRSIICLAVVITLTGLTGCAKQETAPAAEPEAPIDAQEISNEDFETGEVDGVVESNEGEVEEDPAGEDSSETP
jgi:hypothetical protein